MTEKLRKAMGKETELFLARRSLIEDRNISNFSMPILRF